MKISNACNKVSLESLRHWNNLTGDNVNVGNKLIVGFLISNEMPVVTITEKKEPPANTVKTEKTETQPAVSNIEAKQEEKIEKTESVKEKTIPVTTATEVKSTNPEQGYFKSSFDQQVKVSPVSKNATVTSGIFKTTSGWQDAKYYMLMDGVQPGTIIRIINPDNNKTVYAKVLGEMSGIRQNDGLNIRISNAAAAALQVAEQDKFIVKVNYTP